MAEQEPKKKPKKIFVDKDYFDMINKAVDDMNKNTNKMGEMMGTLINEVKEIKTKSQVLVSGASGQATFVVQEIFFDIPKDSSEKPAFEQRVGNFRNELQAVMRKYKVGQVQAVFLYKF